MYVLPLSRPMAIATRSPSFSSVVDRFFDESLDRFIGSARALAETRTPTMDVRESDTGYTVVLDVPGATREQLKVQVEGRRVTVSSVRSNEKTNAESDVAEPKAEAATDKPAAARAESADKPVAPKADRVIYRERSTVAYARTIVLPAEVDQAASQAKFENGVLTLLLAKQTPAGASQLAIA